MKYLIFLILSFNLFAGTMPNNNYKIGDGSVTTDKGFTFDTGDGASNVILKVDDSKKLKFNGNDVQLGDGVTANDKCIVLDPSADSKICWNGTDQKLTFNNGNGGTEKGFGSGGGAGGGENYNNAFGSDQNPDAEDGTTGWTASAGSFAASTSDPLNGAASFTWTPAAQNDTLTGPTLDVDKDIFKGRSCEARIEYIGGDENLTLQVIDANNDVLGSEELEAYSIAGQKSVFFLCPSSTDISGDADKGDLRLRLDNEGATASAQIKFDLSYVGTLRGLTEAVLPDVLSIVVLGTDGSKVSGSDGISPSRSSTGTYALDYTSLGLSVTPAIHIEMLAAGTQWQCSTSSNSATSAAIECHNNSNVKVDKSFSVTLIKQGTDAKQAVQVYKSIPTTAINQNEFGFEADISSGSSCVKSQEFPSSSGVTCAYGGSTGRASLDWTALGLTNAPACTCTSRSTSGRVSCAYTNESASGGDFNMADDTTATNGIATIKCVKTGSDFKMPTVQPLVVGSVVNSYADSAKKNVRVESCYITNSGTPATSNDLCDTWIDSISDLGTGNNYININSSIFSSNPVCTANVSNDSHSVRVNVADSNAVGVLSYTVNTNTLIDAPFNLICVGEK